MLCSAHDYMSELCDVWIYCLSYSPFSCVFADVEDPEVFELLLSNEKENFKVLFEKVIDFLWTCT